MFAPHRGAEHRIIEIIIREEILFLLQVIITVQVHNSIDIARSCFNRVAL